MLSPKWSAITRLSFARSCSAAAILYVPHPCDVLAGADAALGDAQLQLVFYNPAPGAPLPDLMELLAERFSGIVSITFRANAAGTLRSAFGVRDGTPGRASVTQVGTLFRTSFRGATADGFPAERICLCATGH